VNQKGSLGVKLHALGSARKCEGIDLHTPKGTPTLGDGVLEDPECLENNCKGQNPMN